MIEDDFYATIKLSSGEEIFAKVAACEEEDKTLLIVNNPVTISEVKTKTGYGYKIEPWLKTTDEDMFIINIKDIITMSESNDIEMISMHQSFTKKIHGSDVTNKKLNREMGYICNINDAKEILEKIFKSS
jgi:hypothetical protein